MICLMLVYTNSEVKATAKAINPFQRPVIITLILDSCRLVQNTHSTSVTPTPVPSFHLTHKTRTNLQVYSYV